MPNVIEIVKTTIEEHHLLPAKGRIVVAVSGGADSLCLLHLLHSLCGPGRPYPEVQLHVAHLNHQLRGEESEHEAEAVARLAACWSLPVSVGSTDIAALARHEQRSLEEAARTARYRFLREIARGDRIAVAHHADDQAETLLLHWLRGGGIGSMIGLQPLQRDIIRPLLAITHADALAYCAAHGLTPAEDASNADPRFLRNRIRHELLPLLEELNPGFRGTLLRTAEVMQVDAEWIEAQVDAAWSTVVIAEMPQRIHLNRSALRALPLSIQRHLVRRVTARLCDGQSPLELRHYKLIEQLARRTSKGRELERHLPDHLRMLRSGEDIFFERVNAYQRPEEESEQAEVILELPGQVVVPGMAWIAMAEIITGERASTIKTNLVTGYNVVYIDGDRMGTSLRVRSRRPGDRIQPLGMEQEKKVQDILVDRHIPRSEREHIPLFFSEEHAVWLGGICIDERVRLTAATQKIVRLSLIPYEGREEDNKL
jgi:tRNA(Ile)-lysidine synthase